MSKIVINFDKKLPPYTTVYADNKPLTFEKSTDNHNNITTSFQTINNEVTLKIVRHSTLSTRLWFIYEMFFFFICIFGIFDMHERVRFVTDCQCTLKIKTSSNVILDLSIMKPRINGNVVKFGNPNNISVISNDYILNNTLKSRKRIIKVFKILSFLGFFGLILGLYILTVFSGN